MIGIWEFIFEGDFLRINAIFNLVNMLFSLLKAMIIYDSFDFSFKYSFKIDYKKSSYSSMKKMRKYPYKN